MALFLLHDDRNPEKDMFVINPSVVPVDDEAALFANDFTEDAHNRGRTTEELIPIADTVIELANQS